MDWSRSEPKSNCCFGSGLWRYCNSPLRFPTSLCLASGKPVAVVGGRSAEYKWRPRIPATSFLQQVGVCDLQRSHSTYQGIIRSHSA
jgi:hypothetical protein